MAVPITGNFLMFGTSSNVTIAGAIIEGGANAETVSLTLNFNALKGLADIAKFDTNYSEGATTLGNITKTIQFRGYPTSGGTTTTTTTTVAPNIIDVRYDSVGLDNSLKDITCAAPIYSAQIFGDPGNNNPVFCGPDELLAIDLTNILATNSIPVGSSFYLSSGGQVRSFIRQFNDNIAYRIGECDACSATTTTSTTTSAPGPCSLTLYFNVTASPSPGGFDSQALAYAGTGTPLTIYTISEVSCPTTFQQIFNDGKIIYIDSALTTPLQGNDKFFKDVSSSNSGNTIQIGNDGFIDSIGTYSPSTTTTTTTTAASTTTTSTTSTTTSTTTTTTAAPTTTTTTSTTTTTAAPTIFTHGAVIAICSDYCNANFNITTSTFADGNFASLTIGDTIYGQGGVAGFVAYSDVSTDTTTGPFRIAEIDSSGVVVSIKVCVGGNCEVL